MKDYSTKKITTIGIMSALATILAIFIHIPLIPAVSFLTYEPKNVIIVILGFIYGPAATVVSSFICSVLEVIFLGGNVLDIVMNMTATIGYATVAAYIYKKMHSKQGAVVGLCVGVIVTTILMALWNYVVTPIYYGWPRESVVAIMLPGIIPFNFIKAGLNTAITLYLYKPIVSILRRANIVENKNNSTTRDSKSIIITATFILVTLILVLLAFNGII